MPNVILTPLMNLPNPVPSVDPGPDYAQNLYNSLVILDGHNHTAGSGNPITPAAININADLPFNTTNNLTLVRSARFVNQSAALAGAADLGCVYEAGGELYYNDASGNQVKLTAGGVVNATSSGISSGTATASFSGSVLVVNQNTNTPGNIQCGSVFIGNNIVSSNFAEVSAPSSLASNYQLTLPTVPASQKFMTLDSSGNMAAPWAVDNSTLEISGGSTVQVKDSGIVTAKLADNSVTTAKIVNLNVTRPKLEAVGQNITSSCGNFTTNSSSFVDVTNLAAVIVTTGRPVMVMVFGDKSGSDCYFGAQVTNLSTASAAAKLDIIRTGSSSGTVYIADLSSTSGQIGAHSPAIQVPVSICLIDPVGAGTYTYTVQLFAGTNTTAQLANAQLCVYEL